MAAPNYELLLKKLVEEGSFEDYYRHLKHYYGTTTSGSVYSLYVDDKFPEPSLEEGACNPDDVKDFIMESMLKDLYHKPLETLFWIAEAEREYTNLPYFRAIDIYYRLNPPPGAARDEVAELVREFEVAQRYSKEGSDWEGLLR